MKKVSNDPLEIGNKQSAFGTKQSAENLQFKKQSILPFAIHNSQFAIILLLFTFLVTPVAFAQNPDEEKQQNAQETEDAIEEDTMDEGLTSDFTIRVDYLSKVLSAGRDFGVSQYGITPSLAYYHKSGLFISLSGSIYSQTEPKYAMTDLSLGYSNVFNFAPSWSYSVSYDRYFFNPDSGGLLKNAFGLYTNYDFGPINAGVSYSLMFSPNETAHRLNPSINGYFILRKVGFIDKISFSPGISATIGTSNVPFSVLPEQLLVKGEGVTREEFLQLKSDFWTQIQQSTGKSYAQYQSLYGKEYRAFKNQTGSKITFPEYLLQKGYIPNEPIATSQTKQYFGIMSWNFSLPVRFRIGNLGLGITYNYVIPQALPDESYTNLTNQSYISANINYTFSK